MISFETALRGVEVLLALALIQRALEHVSHSDRLLFGMQLGCSVLLLINVLPTAALLALWTLAAAQLVRFQGPYNGGADKMAVLVLTCVLLAGIAPTQYWAEMAMSYLAVQVVLSYFVSGWVKLRNRDWRSGQALSDVFAFSAYPVSEDLRSLSSRPRLMQGASLGVIGFETLFPIVMLHPIFLAVGLCVTAIFHLANACLFGLNRFFWIWISAYPALFWFQGRVFG